MAWTGLNWWLVTNIKRAKTNRGRFSSKYALTERLVCGICGSLYRRVTWSIHGRKEIVWRCINRLEYGSRICGSSPTIREELLHDAIMKAIQNLILENQNDMAASLQKIILQCAAQQNQGTRPDELHHRLEELNRELDRLLTFAGNDLTDLRIKQISDEMLRLRQQEKQLVSCADYARGREDEMREVIALLDDISIDFRFNPERGASDIYVNGDRAEGRIRTIEVSNCVSRVSSIRQVREKLVAMQQAMGRQRGVVMDGRDIGTVVFPNAEMKIFMTADPEVRARRRYDELLAKGDSVSLEEIRANIVARDKADMTRAISPLRQADDAVVLDNSHMTVEEQMTWFMERFDRIACGR